MTSSPLDTPIDFKHKISASVPLFVETTYFAPIYFANFFSKLVINLPRVKSEVFINFFF